MDYRPYLPAPFGDDPRWLTGKLTLDKLYEEWHNSSPIPRSPRPEWLWKKPYVSVEQQEDFTRRLLAAVHRYLVKHRGEMLQKFWWNKPIAGVCRAFKGGAVGNSAFGFSIMQKGRVNKLWKKIAASGMTRKEYMLYSIKGQPLMRIKREAKACGLVGDRALPPSQRGRKKGTTGVFAGQF